MFSLLNLWYNLEMHGNNYWRMDKPWEDSLISTSVSPEDGVVHRCETERWKKNRRIFKSDYFNSETFWSGVGKRGTTPARPFPHCY
jgi:hypothetical protein